MPDKQLKLNKDGLTEEEFLNNYNPGDYERPSVTVDMLIFTFEKQKNILNLLMIKRGNHPSIGQWALPGGFVEMNENLDEAAARELKEETGLENITMKQLYTWGDVGRDPRTRIISTSYMSLIEGTPLDVEAADDAADARWFKVSYELINEESNAKNYKLMLKSGDIEISAVLNKTTASCGYFSTTKYNILSNDGIALDHAKVIAQAVDSLNLT